MSVFLVIAKGYEMGYRTLGILSLALSAASRAFISHNDTSSFYALVFFVVGIYAFVQSEIRNK
jgi:hypothetical protein